MNNIYANPTPLRQRFIEYLTLNRKAERTVHIYVSFIYSLARDSRRSPDLLGPEDIRRWLYHLIAERKQAPFTVNLAINAARSFYGGLLQRQIEPLLHQNRLHPPRGYHGSTARRTRPAATGLSPLPGHRPALHRPRRTLRQGQPLCPPSSSPGPPPLTPTVHEPRARASHGPHAQTAQHFQCRNAHAQPLPRPAFAGGGAHAQRTPAPQPQFRESRPRAHSQPQLPASLALGNPLGLLLL